MGKLSYVAIKALSWDRDVVVSWDLRGTVWEEALGAVAFAEVRPGVCETRYILATS